MVLSKLIERLTGSIGGKIALGGITALAVGIAGFTILTSAECKGADYGPPANPDDVISTAQKSLKGIQDNPNIPDSVKADMKKKYEADIAAAEAIKSGKAAGGSTQGGAPKTPGK